VRPISYAAYAAQGFPPLAVEFMDALEQTVGTKTHWVGAWRDDQVTPDESCGECRVPFVFHDEFVFKSSLTGTLICIECAHQVFGRTVEIPEVLA
jgi:hypothetical protein